MSSANTRYHRLGVERKPGKPDVEDAGLLSVLKKDLVRPQARSGGAARVADGSYGTKMPLPTSRSRPRGHW
jgi:hypothetical protein